MTALDDTLESANRALARGDPLGALRFVALRDDAYALALRGVAMAQLGEYGRARELLARAVRAFGARHALARSRCIVALAEIAIANRDLDALPKTLPAALHTLDAQGDRVNALHARLIALRRLVLIGRVAEAERALSALPLRGAPSLHAGLAALIRMEIALRGLHARRAEKALAVARASAERAGIPQLRAEIAAIGRSLAAPVARAIRARDSAPLKLAEVERLFDSRDLIVDACRRCVTGSGKRIALQRRPVLFALARCLAEDSPEVVSRERLIAEAFASERSNDTHRARLRVELARLRKLLAALAEVRAGPGGFALVPRGGQQVVVLAPPIEGEDAAVLALLADGSAWSSSALALALGVSQRNVQRALAALEERGDVRSIGRARARRWLCRPLTEIAPLMLLPLTHRTR